MGPKNQLHYPQSDLTIQKHGLQVHNFIFKQKQTPPSLFRIWGQPKHINFKRRIRIFFSPPEGWVTTHISDGVTFHLNMYVITASGRYRSIRKCIIEFQYIFRFNTKGNFAKGYSLQVVDLSSLPSSKNKLRFQRYVGNLDSSWSHPSWTDGEADWKGQVSLK